MDRRLPARLLALLALAAVSVALYTVLTSGGGASGGSGKPAAAPAAKSGQAAKATKAERRRSRRRTYTIRAGDTPSGIAERTGVSVERLIELNPDVDSQALQTGTKLKLR